MKKKLLVHVIGGPYCGKGTVCKSLASEHGFAVLGMGDTYRANREHPEFGRRIRIQCDSGLLVDDDIQNRLFPKVSDTFMVQNHGRNLAFDSTFRSPGQAGLVGYVRDSRTVETYDFLQIFLQMEKKEGLRRLRHILAGEDPNRVGRFDDQERLFETRWREYVDKTIPGAENVEAMGVQTHRIRIGDNEPKESVNRKVCHFLKLPYQQKEAQTAHFVPAFVR